MLRLNNMSHLKFLKIGGGGGGGPGGDYWIQYTTEAWSHVPERDAGNMIWWELFYRQLKNRKPIYTCKKERILIFFFNW